MDLERCDNCGSEALELKTGPMGSTNQRWCLFCWNHQPVHGVTPPQGIWAARVANYLERRLVERIQAAVSGALEVVGANPPRPRGR